MIMVIRTNRNRETPLLGELSSVKFNGVLILPYAIQKRKQSL